jgi:hypothetical protein
MCMCVTILCFHAQVLSEWRLSSNWTILESESYIISIFSLLSDSCRFVDMRHSLTRWRVCHLQLLLALASAVIFRSWSRATCDHILLSQIWDFLFRGLLWLTRLWWRYLTPLPHEISNIHYFFKLCGLHVTLLAYHFSCLITMRTTDFWRSLYICTPLKYTGLPNVYFCFPHITVLDVNLLKII